MVFYIIKNTIMSRYFHRENENYKFQIAEGSHNIWIWTKTLTPLGFRVTFLCQLLIALFYHYHYHFTEKYVSLIRTENITKYSYLHLEVHKWNERI